MKTIIPYYPMRWNDRRIMDLIERKTKGRWWGIEERIEKFPQPLFGIMYLLCYFLLELPLFFACMQLDLIFHPLEHAMEFINHAMCLFHKHNRNNLIPVHPKYNYYLCPLCYKHVVVYPNNKLMIEDKDHSIMHSIIKAEGEQAYWDDMKVMVTQMESERR